MYCNVKKSVFSGDIYISSSKSETMRAIALAALSTSVSRIENILLSPDIYAMIEGVRAFGVKIIQHDTTLTIFGVNGELSAPKEVIDVGNSGLALRFLLAFACLIEEEVCITGDESIRTRRVMTPLLEVYKKSGMRVKTFKETNYRFLSVAGKLKPSTMIIAGKDSQLVSSLLISTSFLTSKSTIIVTDAGEKPWVDMTVHYLERLGAKIKQTGHEKYEVLGNLSYDGFNCKIGGDYSTALFPIAAALVSNGFVTIHGLERNSYQADAKALDIFRKMGASIEFTESKSLEAFLIDSLVGVEVDINDCIDVLPILCVLASKASSKTVILGYEIAKRKECNRVEAMMKQLHKMGALIIESGDRLTIYPRKLHASKVQTHKDHRIALSLLVAGIMTEDTTSIEEIEVSVKSYPQVIYDFITCGVNLELCVKAPSYL